MRRYIRYLYAISLVVSSLLLASCGQDRSGEYYALIGAKTWMYEVMQQHYLFYEDLPAEEELNFFDKPEDFLQSVVSSQDQKNGSVFSHIDSVNVSRVQSDYPTFGLEGALVRNANGDYVVHILYVYPDSPAAEVGLKRDDWVVDVDGRALNTSNYTEYFQRPASSYRYRVATVKDGLPDTSYIDMPAPRIIDQPSVFTYKTISAGGRTAFYILYNSFETADEDLLKAAFNEAAAQSPTDIILDLLKPVSYRAMLFFRMLGTAGMEFAATFVLVGGIYLFVNGIQYLDFFRTVLFFIALLMGMGVKFCIQYLFSLMCFYTDNAYGVSKARETLTNFFSGALVPLAMFPGILREAVNFLPFRGIVYTPCCIFIGFFSIRESIIYKSLSL